MFVGLNGGVMWGVFSELCVSVSSFCVLGENVLEVFNFSGFFQSASPLAMDKFLI